MFAYIEGKIVMKAVQTPEKKKPYQQISILQMSDTTAEIIKIKDYDLNRQYNGDFAAHVQIFPWAMEGKFGVALTREDDAKHQVQGGGKATQSKRDLG